MPKLAEAFRDNVRMARLALRMSQDELARATGLSRMTVNQIESADKSRLPNTTMVTIEFIAKALGKEPLELLTPRNNHG